MERKGKTKRPSTPPFPRGVGTGTEHRPTLPTGQPNDRLFADGPRKKEEGKEIAHRSEEASATNYADLCPHCPLSLSAWSGPRPFFQPALPLHGRERFDGRGLLLLLLLHPTPSLLISLSLSLQQEGTIARTTAWTTRTRKTTTTGGPREGKRHARNRPATEKGTQGGPPMRAELRPLPASLSHSLFPPSLPSFSRPRSVQDVVAPNTPRCKCTTTTPFNIDQYR